MEASWVRWRVPRPPIISRFIASLTLPYLIQLVPSCTHHGVILTVTSHLTATQAQDMNEISRPLCTGVWDIAKIARETEMEKYMSWRPHPDPSGCDADVMLTGSGRSRLLFIKEDYLCLCIGGNLWPRIGALTPNVRCSYCTAVSSSTFQQAVGTFGQHDLEVMNGCKMKTNWGLVWARVYCYSQSKLTSSLRRDRRPTGEMELARKTKCLPLGCFCCRCSVAGLTDPLWPRSDR